MSDKLDNKDESNVLIIIYLFHKIYFPLISAKLLIVLL